MSLRAPFKFIKSLMAKNSIATQEIQKDEKEIIAVVEDLRNTFFTEVSLIDNKDVKDTVTISMAIREIKKDEKAIIAVIKGLKKEDSERG